MNRALQGELNISTIDPLTFLPVFNSEKVLNPYVLGLDLAVLEHQGESNYYPMSHQIGTGFNDGPGNTGYQIIHCGDKVLDSYRVELDLAAYDNVELDNPGTSVNQFGTGFRDKPSNTDNQYRFSGDKVLAPQRAGSDLATQGNGSIDFLSL